VSACFAGAALSLLLLPRRLLPVALPLLALCLVSPLAAFIPSILGLVLFIQRRIAAERQRDLFRRQFGDLLLALSLGALEGYGVYNALAHLPDLVPPPLGTHVRRLSDAVKVGEDVDGALTAFGRSVSLPAADRLIEAVRRERLFGLGLGETLVHQLELLHVEEEEALRRHAALLPYLFTISVGILFLCGGLVLFLPALHSLILTLEQA
jgi:Flp pilus assembly protein TadB